MKIGLIGYGYWGKNILRNLNNFKNIKTIHCLDKNIYRNYSNIFFMIMKKNFLVKK